MSRQYEPFYPSRMSRLQRWAIRLLVIGVIGALLFRASEAMATGQHDPDPPRATASADADAHSAAVAGASAVSGSVSVSRGGEAVSRSQSNQAQQQTAQGGAANNEGNSLTVSSHYEEKRQAPDVSAPAVYASHSCALGWSIGATGPGAGISGGKAKADPSCERREWARVLWSMNPALALKVACSDPIVAAVVGEGDCVYVTPPAAPEPTAYATKDDVEAVRRDSQQAIERAFKTKQGK